MEYPHSLKVAGIPKYHGGYTDFVGDYFRKFDPLMKNADYTYEPYTVICVWSSLLGEKRANSWESGDRIWGCLVNSLENLPEGISGADLGVKKFLVMTVRGQSWADCDTAVDYPNDCFRELMPQQFAGAVYPPIQEVNWHFEISADAHSYMSYLEADSEITIGTNVVIYERKYYAPLKY